MIPLILQVLKDFRVIGTVIVMILVIKFAKFIRGESPPNVDLTELITDKILIK